MTSSDPGPVAGWGSGAPLVSVVMPVKDAARFLRESMESVLAQTWPLCDVVLVDDGGSDGSEVMVREFAAADPQRVRVVTHEGRVNKGIGPSRALGIREARGALVAFLDADDVWEPTHLEDHLRLLLAHPEADMVCGRVWAWRSWADPAVVDLLSELAFAPGAVVAGPRLLAAVLRNGNVATTPCALTVRRPALLGCLEHLARFPGMYEDQVMNSWLQLRRVAVMTGGTTAWYRQHAESFSARDAARNGERIRARLAFLTWLRSQAEDTSLDDREVIQLVGLALERAAAACTPDQHPGPRSVLKAVTAAVVRRGSKPLRRAVGGLVPVPAWARTTRIERLLFRHGADVRGDVLLLGDTGVAMDPDRTMSVHTGPWTELVAAAGPCHPLASLGTASYDCLIALPDGPPGLSMVAGLRHLRRALRPAGVLLLVLPTREETTEQALRELFGRDQVSTDEQHRSGPPARPLVLMRAAIPAAGR